MITTTMGRMSGKLLKSCGWWQVLVLTGLCAWLSTPVDAQQNLYQPQSGYGVPANRGFNDDGDNFPQSDTFPRSRVPQQDRWDDRSGQSLRQSPQSRTWQGDGSIERIDLRPNRNDDWGVGRDYSARTGRQRTPAADDTNFVNPRQRQSNYPATDFQGPAFEGSEYQGSNTRNRGYSTPHRQSPDLNNSNYQVPSFPNPAYQNPVLQGPAFQNPASRTQPLDQAVNPVQEAQARITRRYQNQSFLSLLNLPPQQSVALYGEVMQMIDSRHLEPTTPQVRVQKGMTNLMLALDVPAFVQTNQLNLNQANVQAYRQALQQALQSPVQTQQDAVNLLNWTMQMSQQQIGLRPAATALEFTYGAVESLDKYSAFVPPERTPGASLQLESKLVGIGVQIEMNDQGAEVEKVITGSPAQQAGIQKSDLLLAVSGQQLAGMSIDETVELISGPAGSPVVLGVQRQNQGPFTVTVTRQAIQLHSVNDIQMLNGTRVGYFKLDKFTATATDEVENALQQLYRQGMQSLVMDLRGNPGGLLTAAIQISDKFLPQGTIVATRGRTPSDNTEEHATKEHTWKIPLVVLVDHNSASASEIFAAAIQENQRGIVVGRTSYGKGTVQTQFPLQTAGCSLRITTAKFYSPTGRVMAGSGVVPDVQVPESNASNQAAFGIMDSDVQAALSVAQQGGLPQNQNQNLSGLRNPSQSRIPQPFAPFGR